MCQNPWGGITISRDGKLGIFLSVEFSSFFSEYFQNLVKTTRNVHTMTPLLVRGWFFSLLKFLHFRCGKSGPDHISNAVLH